MIGEGLRGPRGLGRGSEDQEDLGGAQRTKGIREGHNTGNRVTYQSIQKLL